MQYSRLLDDVNEGTWTPMAGGLPLFPYINGVNFNDSSFIQTGANNDTCTMVLRELALPPGPLNQILTVRAGKQNPGTPAQLTIALIAGPNTVFSITVTLNPGFGNFTHTLS